MLFSSGPLLSWPRESGIEFGEFMDAETGAGTGFECWPVPV